MIPTPPTNLIQIMNEISIIEEDNLLDKIASYCEKNNYDPQEVGDILGESEQFKDKLYIDLVHNHVIKDPGFTKKDNLTEEIDEW